MNDPIKQNPAVHGGSINETNALQVIEQPGPVTTLEPSVQKTETPMPTPATDLIATNPGEMRHAQSELIGWVGGKIALVQREIEDAKSESSELAEAFDIAKKRKWQTATIDKHHQLAIKRVGHAEKRLAYYTKIMAALQAGYYIVPPMGMEIFAIRTDREKPAKMWQRLSTSRMGNFQQEAKVLPSGHGDYKNPQPEIEPHYAGEAKDERTGIVTRPYTAEGWNEIDFPVNMIKPQIMEATSRAMALKIFDEMGVLPQDYKRNPDPVILGKIRGPKKHQNDTPPEITFLIAWHLNTKDL